MAKKIRIATDKETGKKYIVSFLSFSDETAFLRGEVKKYVGLHTYHEKTFSVPLASVEIEETEKTQNFVIELMEQWKSTVKIVCQTGSKYNRKTYYEPKNPLDDLTDEIRQWVVDGEITLEEAQEMAGQNLPKWNLKDQNQAVSYCRKNALNGGTKLED